MIIPNTNLGVSVPIEKYQEIHNILKATMRDYKYLTGNKCTKGKALLYLINHGFNKFQDIIEEKEKHIQDTKKKLDKIKKEVILK